MSVAPPSRLGEGRGRLDELLEDLDLERSEVDGGGDLSADAFFTARVVECLPAPLRGTGLRPTVRTTLLVGVHLLAALLGYVVLTSVTPGWFEPVARHAHEWLEFQPDAAGAASLALGLGLVAVVAFLCCRSHTAAT